MLYMFRAQLINLIRVGRNIVTLHFKKPHNNILYYFRLICTAHENIERYLCLQTNIVFYLYIQLQMYTVNYSLNNHTNIPLWKNLGLNLQYRQSIFCIRFPMTLRLKMVQNLVCLLQKNSSHQNRTINVRLRTLVFFALYWN